MATSLAIIQSAPNREAWLAERQTGLGSSDAAAILGLSRYKSALALFHQKRGLELPTDDDLAVFRKMGLMLEPVIAELYHEETHRDVRTPPPFTVARHAQYPFLLASIDRWAWDAERAQRLFPLGQVGADDLVRVATGVLELKNVSSYVASRWLDLGEVPIEYQLQLQHQLLVTGAPWGSIAALIGGVTFRWCDYEADEELQAMLLTEELAFWHRIQADEPPPADGSDSTRELLHKLHAKTGEGVVVPMPVELLDADLARQDAIERMKLANGVRQEAENKIMAFLQANEAQIGLLPNGARYTWRKQSRAGYTVAPTEFPVLRRSGGK